jgi:hypothetical protein
MSKTLLTALVVLPTIARGLDDRARHSPVGREVAQAFDRAGAFS